MSKAYKEEGLFVMQRVSLLVLLSVMVMPVSGLEPSVGSVTAQPLEIALLELRVTEKAWRRNDAQFRTLRKEGQASETELREFAEFVAGLQRRLFEDCLAARQLGGEPRDYGIDCAVVDQQLSELPKELASPSTALTEQEEGEQLVAELSRLEGELDGMLLQEQDLLKQRRQGSAGRGGSAGGGMARGQSQQGAGAGTEEAADNSQQGSGEGASATQGDGGSTGLGAGSGAVKGAKVDRKNIPADVGSGDDDDIVARQLREAAELEPDPILREQLWAEYRKYKASIH
jgi:hypothetical protein